MSARGRHRRERARRVTRVSLMLTAGGAGVALPLLAAGGASAAAPAAQPVTAPHQAPQGAAEDEGSGVYTVVSGDTLFKIATSNDVDGGWRSLYDANRDVIGDDPDVIFPGQELRLDGAPASGAAEEAPAKEAPAEEAPAEEAPAEEAPAEEAAAGYTAPVAGAVTTGYGVAGAMWSSGYHTGIDFPVATGTPVVAITSGEVVSAGNGGAYGNEVVIRHDDGHYSQYAHLSSLAVSAGERVTTGQQIGLSGATGNVTGPHLHFEVRTGPSYGSDVDPLAYLRSHGVAL
jgi:murein DD-endopeptidase MepM/ murein hydrolase activator NlpD